MHAHKIFVKGKIDTTNTSHTHKAHQHLHFDHYYYNYFFFFGLILSATILSLNCLITNPLNPYWNDFDNKFWWMVWNREHRFKIFVFYFMTRFLISILISIFLLTLVQNGESQLNFFFFFSSMFDFLYCPGLYACMLIIRMKTWLLLLNEFFMELNWVYCGVFSSLFALFFIQLMYLFHFGHFFFTCEIGANDRNTHIIHTRIHRWRNVWRWEKHVDKITHFHPIAQKYFLLFYCTQPHTHTHTHDSTLNQIKQKIKTNL